jgi:hypothetical protein
VPGLPTEAPTADDPLCEPEVMILESLELDGVIDDNYVEVPFSLIEELATYRSYC